MTTINKLQTISLIFILTFSAFAEVSINAQVKTSVAVMNLKTQDELASASGILSDRLRSELFNSGAFSVMERGEMDAVLKEQGFQASGACDDEACIVEMGQLLGVDKIIGGSIGKLGKIYLINLRIIDIKTGKLIKTYSGECRCPIEELGAAMKTSAMSLAGKSEQKLDVAKKDIITKNSANVSKNENIMFKSTSKIKDKTVLSQVGFKNPGGVGFSLGSRVIEADLHSFIGAWGLLDNNIGVSMVGDGVFPIESAKELLLRTIIPVSKYVAIKLDAGYYGLDKTTSFTVTRNIASVSVLDSLNIDQSLMNLPLKVGVVLSTKPLAFKFRAKGGLDFVFFLSRYAIEFNNMSDMVLFGTGSGLDFFIGGEFMLGKHFGLGLELNYSAVTISNYIGDGDLRILRNIFPNKPIISEDEDLRLVDLGDDDQSILRLIPSEMLLDDENNAEIDFSGFGSRLTFNLYL